MPDGSGTGRRIVYSLGEKRVWLVDASEATRRTFTVWPGSVSPEHIVYFAAKSGVSVALSNAVDGASPPPAASGTKTGGVRTRKADGTALWAFGTVGTTVTVVRWRRSPSAAPTAD